jgi:hypothetical protein
LSLMWEGEKRSSRSLLMMLSERGGCFLRAMRWKQ